MEFLWLVLKVLQGVAKGRILYISRSGEDRWSCDQSTPCKTIWRAVTLASSGDHVHIDGTNTDKDPYTCQSGTSEHPGIYINRSLFMIGSASPMPQIRCTEGTGLTFNGSDTAERINVTLSGLHLKESFVSVQDSSVNIDGCKFEGSTQGLEFAIRTRMVSSIEITNSAFLKNSKCISVNINSTKIPSQNIQVAFTLTNSSFERNVISDDGECIFFTESSYSNQSKNCNITLENVTFSRNKFSSKGLVFLDMDSGNQNIHLQNVTLIDNRPSSGRNVLRDNSDSECILRGTSVNIFIDSSNFASQTSRLLNVSASNISFQIYKSIFVGHRCKGNGGVVFMRGTEVCKLNVSSSSFVNTTAAQGGAVNIECAKIYSISFQDNNFTDNKALNSGGGAVYIDDAFSSFSKDSGYETKDKAELNASQGQIDITKCDFSNALSFGGAMYVKARKASIRLRHSAFTNCRGGGFIIDTDPISIKMKVGSHLVLTVEMSRFERCRSRNGSNGGAALEVLYASQIEISINKCHFTSNNADGFGGFGGGAISVGRNSREKFEGANHANVSNITIRDSIFSNNGAENHGGAISIIANPFNQNIIILQKLIMKSNKGGAVSVQGSVNIIKVQDSVFDSNYVLSDSPRVQDYGGALFLILSGSQISTSIAITNTTFSNCSAKLGGGAIYLEHGGKLRFQVEKSRFVGNFLFPGYSRYSGGGAIFFLLSPDTLNNSGCIQEGLVSSSNINEPKEFPSWFYKSHLIFEDTTFERNAAYAGGAIYLTYGKAIFRNSYFLNNFATTLGGHIYTGPGSASLIIQESTFHQTTNKLYFGSMNFSKSSFIHAESSGALIVYNSTMDVWPYGSTGPLMLLTNGRLIDLGNNNLTTLYCPFGSQMEITDSSFEIETRINDNVCKVNFSSLEFRCSTCAGNSYSLQRGRALGSQLAPGFQCLPCPFGANCSQNILAKPNFWGFKEQLIPPTLKFTMCPLGYCNPTETTDFPEYNGCQGNRFGELCGKCNESYTETLYSTNCRPTSECKDYWFWPVALFYVSLMAFYFTFKPPTLPWIKRQILWFKEHEPANQGGHFDRGYLKILFYFYQASNLLLVFNSSQLLIETKFIEPIVGLFDFQQKLSSNGFICPFPGLTVVTKHMLSIFHVFGTVVMICVFFILGWILQKFRGRSVSSVGPYIGGILQTLLLGYTTLASVSFNLLRCVSIGSEKRLFYDGSIVCFQWWQYILIAFICTFFVPFVFVLFWGSFKLYSGTLSTKTFLLACCFPLPLLIYWVFISLFCKEGNCANEDSLSNQVSREFVERVLYDSFKRPKDGRKLSLSWESVMIGRRLILVVLKAFISNPMPRLLIMSLFCVVFLLHHALTQPFRCVIANALETISLLCVVFLAIFNMFLASFLSLAVPLNDHFTPWVNAGQAVEIVILCFVPALFGVLVITAVLSQLCRLAVVFCRFLYTVCCISLGDCSRKRDDEVRPPLTETN